MTIHQLDDHKEHLRGLHLEVYYLVGVVLTIQWKTSFLDSRKAKWWHIFNEIFNEYELGTEACRN